MKLIMNDGQQISVQTVAETGGTLKIRLLNQTSAGLKAIFQDALAVQKMTARETGQADRVYEGYTELVCISEYTGAIWEVEMRKTEADPDTRLAQVEEDVEKLKESGGKIPESARLAIPWKANMQPEAGKYYREGDLTAKCVEDPGQPLYNALADLCPGRYFEAA